MCTSRGRVYLAVRCDSWRAELLLNGPDRVTSDIMAMFGYSAVGAVAIAILEKNEIK